MVDSNRGTTGRTEEFSSMSSSSSDISEPIEKGKEMASEIKRKASDVAGKVSERASEIGSHLGERADESVHQVGEKISGLASTIRERAPQGGKMGSAASAVASSLDAGGQYLREHNLTDLSGEVSDIVKRYPMATLWVGVGVGFLLGQALVRR